VKKARSETIISESFRDRRWHFLVKKDEKAIRLSIKNPRAVRRSGIENC